MNGLKRLRSKSRSRSRFKNEGITII